MPRLAALSVVCLLFAAPAAAQTAQEGEMRLYIQQLEERVRQLTGENERLRHEVNQLRAVTGQTSAAAPQQTGAVSAPPVQTAAGAQSGLGTPPQNLGALTVPPGDPLAQPEVGGPIDLSALAGGAPELSQGLNPPSGQQTAAIPVTPAPTRALSGTPRDEYDLAYGYILTGDYQLAEQSFQNWLAAFPNDPQAADAQFWLGESRFQQKEYREAANAFLGVYKSAPQSAKAPDALLKLGMSLAALGEKNAACATLSEVGRKYPNASPALASRVNDEAARAGC
jgi:tol-pal system protein YbgF